jgi:hypothetical protein
LTWEWTRGYIGSTSDLYESIRILNHGEVKMILPLNQTKRDSVLFQLKKKCIKGKRGYRTVGISLYKEQMDKAKRIIKPQLSSKP